LINAVLLFNRHFISTHLNSTTTTTWQQQEGDPICCVVDDLTGKPSPTKHKDSENCFVQVRDEERGRVWWLRL
jgi:hypothetical protein